MEARRREDEGPARVGFTVSKRVAKKAVERNRIRRRLKEAVRQVAPGSALAGFDYVLVGRRSALNERFDRIASELAGALANPSRPPAASRRPPAH
jgi:ribonuclease P protein component